MSDFDLSRYAAPIAGILETAEGGRRLMPLAPRSALEGEGLERLRRSSVEALFEGRPLHSAESASCVQSALYLYLSALDESHTISQNIPSSTGSFLHGIMHRQEPDYGNSKYWFRRVGQHPLFPELRLTAMEWGRASGSSQAQSLGQQIEAKAAWDPFWFVDQCQAGTGRGGDLEQALQELQRLEWQLLFDECYREAVGE